MFATAGMHVLCDEAVPKADELAKILEASRLAGA